MANIQEIDEYQALGNSLNVINDNFANIDTRLCIYDSRQSSLEDMFTSLQASSAMFADFYNQATTLSAGFRDMSDIVYNIQGYWHNTATIVYQNTFSVMANYVEILEWLNTHFTDFSDNQLVRVQYLVKSYDDIILNGQALDNITISTLNSLATSYKLKTADIQRYIVLDNHIQSIISLISNILTKSFIKTKIKTTDDVDALVGSFSIHKNVISSPLLKDLSYDKTLTIWSLLEQYEMLIVEYKSLQTLGISNVPSSVLSKFNTKSVSETFIGSFCYRWSNSIWSYSPSCANEICVQDVCTDCYDILDPNKLYHKTECPAFPRYILYKCDSVVIPPTQQIFTYTKPQVPDRTCPALIEGGFDLQWGGFFLPQINYVTVPDGAVSMKVMIWGNSGSSDFTTSADPSTWWNEPIRYGGGGGYSEGTFHVREGEKYTVVMNAFGGQQFTVSCWGNADIAVFGGGLNGVFRGTNEILPTSYNRALVIAGGGGGANCTWDANHSHGEAGNVVVSPHLLSNTMQGTVAQGFNDSATDSGDSGDDETHDPDVTQDYPGCGGGYRGGKTIFAGFDGFGGGIVNTLGGRGGTGFVDPGAFSPVILPGNKSTSFVKTPDRSLGLLADLTANKNDPGGYYAAHSSRYYYSTLALPPYTVRPPSTDSLRYTTGVVVLEFTYDTNFVE